MDIELIRGDTFMFKFRRKDFNNNVITDKAEKMWFTIKKNYKTTEKLVQKTLEDKSIEFGEDNYYHIRLEHEDTKDLKYKTYVYDIQVENNGFVQTIGMGTITITNEVTFEGRE